jgi:3-hydroxyisobutyrate dehydrogenase-like beta-hydroxyacid dehydrogenase
VASIGYLGLGTMGRGMVGNLLAAGHDVTVWNRTPGRAEGLTGAHEARSLAEAVTDRDFVLACLSDDTAVRAVMLGPDGVLQHVASSTHVVDMSTISPDLSDEEAAAFGARGVPFVDAPVFGSRDEAANGGLWVVVGADDAAFEHVRPVLESVSETVHHMGGPGSGVRMKLVGNSVVAAQLTALGESMTLAKAAGLELDRMLGVLAVTDFRSPIFDGVGSSVLDDDYTPAFALDLMAKDVRLIRDFGSSLGVTLPGAERAAMTLAAAQDAGYGKENASALIKVIARENGVQLSRTAARAVIGGRVNHAGRTGGDAAH